MDANTLETYVKIGQELYPLAKLTVESVIGLARQHDNTDLIDRLTKNKATIDADAQTVADELAALDVEEKEPKTDDQIKD